MKTGDYYYFKAGDLIYNSHDDEYATFIRGGSWDNWITVLKSDGEKCQVQGCWWRLVCK